MARRQMATSSFGASTGSAVSARTTPRNTSSRNGLLMLNPPQVNGLPVSCHHLDPVVVEEVPDVHALEGCQLLGANAVVVTNDHHQTYEKPDLIQNPVVRGRFNYAPHGAWSELPGTPHRTASRTQGNWQWFRQGSSHQWRLGQLLEINQNSMIIIKLCLSPRHGK